MIEALMWIQDRENGKHDKIIVAGEDLTSMEQNRRNVVKKLLDYSKLSAFNFERDLKVWKKNGLSQNFRYLYTTRPAGIYIQSSFEQRDVEGRYIAFMFYMPNTVNMNVAIETLNNIANDNGYTFSEKEIRFLLNEADDSNRFATTITEWAMEKLKTEFHTYGYAPNPIYELDDYRYKIKYRNKTTIYLIIILIILCLGIVLMIYYRTT